MSVKHSCGAVRSCIAFGNEPRLAKPGEKVPNNKPITGAGAHCFSTYVKPVRVKAYVQDLSLGCTKGVLEYSNMQVPAMRLKCAGEGHLHVRYSFFTQKVLLLHPKLKCRIRFSHNRLLPPPRAVCVTAARHFFFGVADFKLWWGFSIAQTIARKQ